MGSPNFKTTNIIQPTFGIEVEGDHQDDGFFVSGLFNDAKEDAKEIDLPFHSIEVESGYHSGFQIYIDLGMSASDVIENLSIEFDGDKPYLVFMDYHGYEKDDIDFTANGAATIERMQDWRDYDVFDADGEPAYQIVTNESKMTELIEEQQAIALHHLAVMAKELGLAPINGITWTSSISDNHEENAKEIEQYIIEELLAPQPVSGASPAP